jgi:hypothetical protein
VIGQVQFRIAPAALTRSLMAWRSALLIRSAPTESCNGFGENARDPDPKWGSTERSNQNEDR